AYGVEARHLRAFRTAADREIGLVQQVLSPIHARSRGTGGKVAHDPTAQILAECIALHTALVKAGLATE
ncbi:MAG: MerR family transcriptional regulator, partial [Dermatophilaceae bacterium]